MNYIPCNQPRMNEITLTMILNDQKSYHCRYCSKNFKRKFNFDRHYNVCKFLSSSKNTIDNDMDLTKDKIPSMEDMYRLIQNMCVRIEKLEEENKKLRQSERRKIKIIDWLNNSKNIQMNITFSQWINDIVLKKVYLYLNVVFESDLLNGIIKLFENLIETAELNKLPIQCFDNKTNIFYIYKMCIDEKEECTKNWVQIKNHEFDTYLHLIVHQFLLDFKNIWYNANKTNIETNERYKDLYIDNYKNILGGDKITDQTRNDRIRDKLYKLLKQNIKQINEYDIT